MADEKKIYATPRLIAHGDVEKITQNNAQLNADHPGGVNDADPNAS